MSTWQIGLSLAGAAAILWISWPSLRDPGTHGFYRFFAFAAILALVVLNMPRWFRDPLAPAQLISWILLLASLGLAVHGFRLLRRLGQPAGSFEETTHLVNSGAYRFIRHPLYASLLLLAWGAFLKDISLSSFVLAGVATAFLTATAKVEERENLGKFGQIYEQYMAGTKMFVPYVV